MLKGPLLSPIHLRLKSTAVGHRFSKASRQPFCHQSHLGVPTQIPRGACKLTPVVWWLGGDLCTRTGGSTAEMPFHD